MPLKKIFSFTLLFLAITVFILSYAAGHSIQHHLFNSDSLYLPVLFKNLLQYGGHIQDWYLTPAPYFFPDYFLFLVAYLSTSTAFAQLVIYALLQILLTAIFLYFLFKTTDKHNAFFASCFTSTLFIFFALESGKPALLLFASAFHYGEFLSGIALIALLINYNHCITHQKRAGAFLFLCVLSFLTTLSDTLFLIQFLAPLPIALGLNNLLLHEKITKNMFAPLFLLFVGITGSLSYTLFITHPTRYSTLLGIAKLKDNCSTIISIFHDFFTQSPTLTIYVLVFYILSIFILAILFFKKRISYRYHTLVFLTLFSLASTGCTLCSTLFSTTFNPVYRYFIPTMFWPLILGVMMLVYILKSKFFCAANILAILCLIYLSSQTIELIKKNGLAFNYYPKEIACLDKALTKYPFKHGIAQYWDAKKIQSFSKKNLTLAQHMDNLDEHPWITSELFFRPTYDFAIISSRASLSYQLSQKKLEELNGPPQATIQCGMRSILIYGLNQLQVRPIIRIGDAHTWQACDLPTKEGHYTPSCAIQSNKQHPQGILSYGPYEPLPAGEYQFEINYSSANKIQETAGDWDVVTAESTGAILLTQGVLLGTEHQQSNITGHFTLKQTRGMMTKIEIRTHLSAIGTMTLNNITIQRVK